MLIPGGDLHSVQIGSVEVVDPRPGSVGGASIVEAFRRVCQRRWCRHDPEQKDIINKHCAANFSADVDRLPPTEGNPTIPARKELKKEKGG